LTEVAIPTARLSKPTLGRGCGREYLRPCSLGAPIGTAVRSITSMKLEIVTVAARAANIATMLKATIGCTPSM
jgi:hypothetical protein